MHLMYVSSITLFLTFSPCLCGSRLIGSDALVGREDEFQSGVTYALNNLSHATNQTENFVYSAGSDLSHLPDLFSTISDDVSDANSSLDSVTTFSVNASRALLTDIGLLLSSYHIFCSDSHVDSAIEQCGTCSNDFKKATSVISDFIGTLDEQLSDDRQSIGCEQIKYTNLLISQLKSDIDSIESALDVSSTAIQNFTACS